MTATSASAMRAVEAVGGWTRLPNVLSNPRCEHGMAAWEDNNGQPCVVVVGGELNGEKVSDSVEAWRIEGGRCVTHPDKFPPLQQKRDGVAAVVCNGILYAIGGHNGKSALNTIECLNVSESASGGKRQWKTFEAKLSSPRYACAAVVVADRFLVVVGGRDGSYNTLRSVDIVDTKTKTTRAGPSMNCARVWCGAMVANNYRVVVVGGKDENITRLASVESISVDSTTGQCRDRQWKVMKATLSTARFGHAVTAMGDCAIVLGGYGSGDRLSSVEVVDTQHDTAWTLPNHNMTDRRNGCAAVTLRDGRVLVTGGHDGSNFLGSAELLQFQVRCIPTVTVVRQGSGVKSGRETALEHWFR